jgi:hypothetical protein
MDFQTDWPQDMAAALLPLGLSYNPKLGIQVV